MAAQTKQYLENLFQGSAELWPIQDLWAGFGAVYAVHVWEEGVVRKLVVKSVSVPAEAENGSEGFRRKIRSYEVEGMFYRDVLGDYATSLVERGVFTAKCWSICMDFGVHSFMFVLSDIREEFPLSRSSLKMEEIRAALHWLAGFHSTFWGKEPKQVWKQGSYWYLDTRREEFGRIPDSWACLQAKAVDIDRLIKSSRFQTVIHGDFKSPNLLFRNAGLDTMECCAFDFQYVGVSLGMRDVVKLFVSSVSPEYLRDKHDEIRLLRVYHGFITQYLTEEYSFEQMCLDYELCLMDYFRFLLGWGLWGTNIGYAEQTVMEILETFPWK